MCGRHERQRRDVARGAATAGPGSRPSFERDGRTWVVFGGYDHNIHFLDAATGERILPDFVTGDIIKGIVTLDPDGYPLVYTGSRDDYYRVIVVRPGQADRAVEAQRQRR